MREEIISLLQKKQLSIKEITEFFPGKTTNNIRVIINRLKDDGLVYVASKKGNSKIYASKDLSKQIEAQKIELANFYQEIREYLYEICIVQGLDNLGLFNPVKITQFLLNREEFIEFIEEFYQPAIQKSFKKTSYFLLDEFQKLQVEFDFMERLTETFFLLLNEILLNFGSFSISNEHPTVFMDIGAVWKSALVSLFGIRWIGFEKDDLKKEELIEKINEFVMPIAKIMDIDVSNLIKIKGEFNEQTKISCDYSHIKLTIHHLGEEFNKMGVAVFEHDKVYKIMENLCRCTKKKLVIGDRIKNENVMEDFIIRDRDRIEKPAQFLNPSQFKHLIKNILENYGTIEFIDPKHEKIYETLIKNENDTALGFNHDHFIWFSVIIKDKKKMDEIKRLKL